MPGKNGTIKKTIAGVIVLLSLCAGFYAANKYWTPREIFNIACAGTTQALRGIQKNIQIQRAQDQVIFLQNQINALYQTKAIMQTATEKQNIQRMINSLEQQKLDSHKRMMDAQR